MTNHMPSAEATRFRLNNRQSRLSNPVGARRASKLVRFLRSNLADLQADEESTAQRRRYGYGLARVETRRVFRELTKDGKLHLVDVITADEIDGVLALLVDGAFVFPGTFPGQLDSNDFIGSGRFKNLGSKVKINKGGAGQTADNDLVSTTSVDSSFIGTGIAYLYTRWGFKQGLFDGDPTVNCIARLRKPVDPRSSTRRFSINPVVQLFDLLTKSADIGGAGIDSALIDGSGTFSAAADRADEIVATTPFTRTAILTTTTDNPTSNHVLEFNQTVVPFNYGDVVRVWAGSGQIQPTGLSPGVDYHVIPIRHALGDFQIPGIAVAATLEDALEGNYIAQGIRTTDINVMKVGEVRYMTGFTYEAPDLPEVVDRLLESCGASLYIDDGLIKITTEEFPGTIETVTEDEITGDVAVSNRLPSEERATEVTGVFNSLLNLFIEKDYPTVGGATFEALDNGEKAPRRVNYPFVGKVGVAQRLATIALRRIRQERTLAFSGSLELYRLKPGTVFSLTKPSLGLDANTTWEVRDQTMFVNIRDDKPLVGIDINARQLESTTFDLTVDDEQLVAEAQIPGLDTPFDVGVPGTPVLTEDLFQTTDGGGLRVRATVTWTASTTGFVTSYRVSYKLQSETVFRQRPETPDLVDVIDDIEPGDYDFQIVAINAIQRESDPASATATIEGLSTPPSDPANFRAEVVGVSVVLTWDVSTDLDVRIGGKVEIRHQADTAGGLGASSILLAEASGDAALAQVPFKRGTYYIRFIDQAGNASGFAEFSLDTRRPVPFGQLISSGVFSANNSTEDQVTIQEDPTFPSTNVNNTLFEDTVNQWLQLPAAETWDDIADVDAVANIDEIGGGDAVAPEGVYFFSSGIALNAVTRMIVETVLETEIVDESASFDAIANVDDVVDIDAIGAGTAQPGQADAWIEARTTRDDPTGSPTFGPWQRVDTGIFNHRAIEFRIQARSFASTVNIRIKQARVLVRELPVDF